MPDAPAASEVVNLDRHVTPELGKDLGKRRVLPGRCSEHQVPNLYVNKKRTFTILRSAEFERHKLCVLSP